MFNERHLKKIFLRLKKEHLDALIISSSANISYLTGYPSSEAYLVISPKKNIYLTDSRYIEAAKRNLKGFFAVKKIAAEAYLSLAETLESLPSQRVGFEEKYLSFFNHKKLRERLKKKIELLPVDNFVEEIRQEKSSQEIEKIRQATRIAALALRFIQGILKPGMKELEVAAELEHFIRYLGGHTSSFETIVASGPNSSLPHHRTSARKIRNNEPVLIDLGVDYYGYKSDLTRVFFLGKITPLIRRIYAIVLAAEVRAIKKIKPAVSIAKIDAAARQYIAQKGFGGFFTHSLGHGIGLEVHEAPRICLKASGRLKVGMVFTVEPAVYLPARFGIRIEDMVLVTKKGAEVLSEDLDK